MPFRHLAARRLLRLTGFAVAVLVPGGGPLDPAEGTGPLLQLALQCGSSPLIKGRGGGAEGPARSEVAGGAERPEGAGGSLRQFLPQCRRHLGHGAPPSTAVTTRCVPPCGRCSFRSAAR